MLSFTMSMVADIARQFAASLAQNLVFVAVAVWIWRRQRLTPAQVGLRRPTRRQVLLGLGLGVGVFAVAYVSGELLIHALQALLPPARYAELVRQKRQLSAEGGFLSIGRSPWLRAAFVFMGAVIAPIGDEALFRGLIYRALRERWGVWSGIIGSSFVFAVAHVSPLTICIVFLIGILLSYAYERTDSLWVPILMHGVNNGLMFALLWQQTN
jgi:membrane protease YdiL (CAAX protease family)